MQTSLSAEEFGRLQITALEDDKQKRKCRLCSYGHKDGPAYSDERCHICLIKRKEYPLNDERSDTGIHC